MKKAKQPYYSTKEAEKLLQIYLRKYRTNYYRAKFNETAKLLPKNVEGKKVLDIGCCAGFFSIYCAKKGAKVLGIDISKNAVEAAKLNAKKNNLTKNTEFILGDFMELDLPEEHYDIIICKDIIEHIPDDIGFVKKISKLLKHGGTTIISTQNWQCFNYFFEGGLRKILNPAKKWVGWDPTHLRWYSKSSLRKKLRIAGLKLTRTNGSYYYPYEFFERLTKYKLNLPFAEVDRAFSSLLPSYGWSISVKGVKR